MTPTKKDGGMITKFWAILQMVVHGVLEGRIFDTLDARKSKKQISLFSP